MNKPPGSGLTGSTGAALSASGGWPFGLYAQRPYYQSMFDNEEVWRMKREVLYPSVEVIRRVKLELQMVLAG